MQTMQNHTLTLHFLYTFTKICYRIMSNDIKLYSQNPPYQKETRINFTSNERASKLVSVLTPDLIVRLKRP